MAERFFRRIQDEAEVMANEIWSLFSETGNPTESAANSAEESAGEGGFDFDPEDLNLDNMSEEEIQQILAEEMFRNNPLQGIAEDVTKNIMAGQAQPQSPMEHFDAFRSAINWKEKFIVGLISFHIVVFLLCLYVSKKDRGLAPRIVLLVIIAVIVRSAEWLNELGEQHWESFATQDYFDKRGVFVGIMLSAPLLVNSLMMLLFFMREASVLLVQVKRNEIERKKQSKENKGNGKKKKSATRAKTTKQE